MRYPKSQKRIFKVFVPHLLTHLQDKLHGSLLDKQKGEEDRI
jgi:hypothetical protein